MKIQGLHHITLVCSNAQQTADFYTRVLGLRLVKKTVNFDDPGSYHLYFGDGLARPGSLVTFFEWPSSSRGAPGIGGTHHFALQVADRDGLLMWKRRLADLGLAVEGPVDRHHFPSISFNDPDGTIIEIAAEREGARLQAETWPEPVPEIVPAMRLEHGMHHITAISSDLQRTHAFFGETLGLHLVKQASDVDDPSSLHWYWGVGDGRPGAVITYVQRDPARERRARIGAGQTHHFALAVADEATQLAWRERLLSAGVRVTEVADRVYFRSIYMQDPDGHIIEIATAGPGFFIDAPADELGTTLRLPPWLESKRPIIEPRLRPVHVAPWREPAVAR
jgi:glyoxalase family protein